MKQRLLLALALSVVLATIAVTGARCEGRTGMDKKADNSARRHGAGGRNRLKNEKSPYLLQHADNPVDWYPWGPEAFQKARKENKPVLLSIGYSTCHWCHVMEHESFEDEEVAELLNSMFVCIKVDREERPDIDKVYMTVCQMVTGSGGWPLTIFMTPDKKPFYAATYLPKTTRLGRPGLMDIARQIGKLWSERKVDVLKSADTISNALAQVGKGAPGGQLDVSVLEDAFSRLSKSFDEKSGGFGGAPKFPTPQNMAFLLRYWKRSGDSRALQMVEKTLMEMRRGGIYDHVGFGFHRYSTDREWLVPHFEKMLYDQALLVIAYTEAYQATGRREFAETAQNVLAYVLRDMTSPEGGFYSAEDADSERVEGKFYLWSENELDKLLGEADATIVKKAFNVRKEGNFVEQTTGHKTGSNIMHMTQTMAEVAKSVGLAEAALKKKIEELRQKLFKAREARVHPHKDDKILTDWNGLMIAAMALAGKVYRKPEFLRAAGKAADFVLEKMRPAKGRLLHRYRDGEAAVAANLDDYAFLVWGLMELYEGTFETRYLRTAIELNAEMLRLFWDEKDGGFFFTAVDSENLFGRRKEIYDGALPSGNSVALLNLLKLGRITADPGLEEKADALIRAFSGSVRATSVAHTQFLCGVDYAIGPSYEVVIAGRLGDGGTQEMINALRRPFLPGKVVLLRPTDKKTPEIATLAGYALNMTELAGKAAAYVCENQQCKFPTTDTTEMLRLLGLKPGK